MPRLIADTSALIVGMTRGHPLHNAVWDALVESDVPPVVSPLVLAEIDYMLTSRRGAQGSLTPIDHLIGNGYEIPTIAEGDLLAARPLLAKYADLNIGLTGAVNVVLADRYGTNLVLTLDERHFRTVRPLTNRHAAFHLLPVDGAGR